MVETCWNMLKHVKTQWIHIGTASCPHLLLLFFAQRHLLLRSGALHARGPELLQPWTPGMNGIHGESMEWAPEDGYNMIYQRVYPYESH